ncbi:MAG: galactokinase, partial [Acidobacteriota bacterium]
LGASAYRTRVAECQSAVAALRRDFPAIHSLRDATPAQVEKTEMPAVVRRRARHIVTENQRVERFVQAAADQDPVAMGALFAESHRSMRDDYEISCDEIDFLVSAAMETEGCYGARMTGGGFGGCTVNLVEARAVPSFRQTMRQRYQSRFGIEPVSFQCIPGAGAGEIHKIS